MQPYEKRVHEELTGWSETVALPVLNKKHFARLVSAIDDYKASAEARPDRGELLTKSTWLAVCQRYFQVDCDNHLEQNLIHALLINHRWRALFGEPDTAHAFVFLVANFVEGPNAAWNKPFTVDMQRRWIAGMPEWIEPTAAPDEYPLRSIARALFGDAWVVLVYDARGDMNLATLVKKHKPEFLPGRLTSGLAQATYALPNLAC